MTRLSSLKDSAISWMLDPHPLRTATLKSVRRFELGSYEFRVGVGAVDRPHYGLAVLQAALLAKRLGIPRISVLEFGVAGGNGLLCLERHAAASAAATGVQVDIYGFDTGHGLPAPTDFRDLPYHWREGFFNMDEEKLRRRLTSASLVLGDVRETVPTFAERYNPAPIGAVMQDLDLYSATKAALEVFEVGPEFRLPRIFAYFDDVIGGEIALYNDYTGERLAIKEFNRCHDSQKIAPAYFLLNKTYQRWHPKMFVVHDFTHPRYDDFVSREDQKLPLWDPA
jgi:hypothetical protein